MNFRRFIAIVIVLGLVTPQANFSIFPASLSPVQAMSLTTGDDAFAAEALALTPASSWKPFFPAARIAALAVLATFCITHLPYTMAQSQQGQAQGTNSSTSMNVDRGQKLLTNFIGGKAWTDFFNKPSKELALKVRQEAIQIDQQLELNNSFTNLFAFIADIAKQPGNESTRKSLAQRWYPLQNDLLRRFNVLVQIRLVQYNHKEPFLYQSNAYRLEGNPDFYEISGLISNLVILYGYRIDKTITSIPADTAAIPMPGERFILIDMDKAQRFDEMLESGLTLAKKLNLPELRNALEILLKNKTAGLGFAIAYEINHEIVHDVQDALGDFQYARDDHFGIPSSDWETLSDDVKQNINIELPAIERQLLTLQGRNPECLAAPILGLVDKVFAHRDLRYRNAPPFEVDFYISRYLLNRLANPERMPKQWIDVETDNGLRQLVKEIFSKNEHIPSEVEQLLKQDYPALPTLILKLIDRKSGTKSPSGAAIIRRPFAQTSA